MSPAFMVLESASDASLTCLYQVDPNCVLPDGVSADLASKLCPTQPIIKTQKWTWAMPIEVVYNTPLLNWNPWNFAHHGKAAVAPRVTVACPNGRLASILTGSAGCWPRNGSTTDSDLAFDGNADKYYFRTPIEFYTGKYVAGDPADTEKGAVGVLDQNKQVHSVRGSGHWVMLPEIEGLGRVRTRYPIFPIHEEGTAAWKEIKAMQGLVLDGQSTLSKTLRETARGITIELTWRNNHIHTLTLGTSHINSLNAGETLVITSSLNNGHQHDVSLKRNGTAGIFELVQMTYDEGHTLAVLE